MEGSQPSGSWGSRVQMRRTVARIWESPWSNISKCFLDNAASVSHHMFHLTSLICVALLIHIPPQMKFCFFKLFPLLLFCSSSAKWPNPRVLSHPEPLSNIMGDSPSHPRNIQTLLKFYWYAKFHEHGHCSKIGTCSPWSSSKHPFLEGSQNSSLHREKLQWGQWLRMPREAFHRGF